MIPARTRDRRRPGGRVRTASRRATGGLRVASLTPVASLTQAVPARRGPDTRATPRPATRFLVPTQASQGRRPAPATPGRPASRVLKAGRRATPRPVDSAARAEPGRRTRSTRPGRRLARPGGYRGPEAYGEVVNGGDYAYVIRPDDPAAPYAQGRGQGPGEWSPAYPGAAQGQPAQARPADPGQVRAITSGTVMASEAAPAAAAQTTRAASLPADAAPPADPPAPAGLRLTPEPVPEIDPALAYGPDDPAYGPPGPDWYKRDEERPPRAAASESPAAAGDHPGPRGPFEPLRPGDREAAGGAGYQPADGEAAFGDRDADALETEISEYDPLDQEMSLPELLDFGAVTDPEAGTLGQIKGLYETAETFSPASFDRHFDQLLERQRELISEYFQESAGLADAEAATPAAPADTPIPLGFDTAESLTGLRGELRAQ